MPRILKRGRSLFFLCGFLSGLLSFWMFHSTCHNFSTSFTYKFRFREWTPFPILSLRAPERCVAIRRSRCEGIARGNLKSSLVLLGTGLRFTRNDNFQNRDLDSLSFRWLQYIVCRKPLALNHFSDGCIHPKEICNPYGSFQLACGPTQWEFGGRIDDLLPRSKNL